MAGRGRGRRRNMPAETIRSKRPSTSRSSARRYERASGIPSPAAARAAGADAVPRGRSGCGQGRGVGAGPAERGARRPWRGRGLRGHPLAGLGAMSGAAPTRWCRRAGARGHPAPRLHPQRCNRPRRDRRATAGAGRLEIRRTPERSVRECPVRPRAALRAGLAGDRRGGGRPAGCSVSAGALPPAAALQLRPSTKSA